MGDHLVLCADCLITAQSLETMQGSDSSGSSSGSSCSQKTAQMPACVVNIEGVEEHGMPEEEEEPLIQTAECRICQEEDTLKNLEIPCACSGSLKVSFKLIYHFCDKWKDYSFYSLSFCSFC